MRQKIAISEDERLKVKDERISLVEDLRSYCHRLRLDEKLISEHWSTIGTIVSLLSVLAVIAAVIAVPMVRWALLFCLLCYPMAVLPTHLIVKRKIADPQFRSSFNFGVRFFISILYTLVIVLVIACCKGILWGLAAIAVVFFVARITGPATVFLRSTLTNTRYWLLRLFRRPAMREINKMYIALVNLI